MFRRHTLIASTVLASALLGACATGSSPAQNVSQAIDKTPQTSTFKAMVEKAGMADTLKAAGPYTVFAPSDAAFKAVPAATLTAVQNNPAQLKALVSYHIVGQRIAAADAKVGNVKSLEGSNLALGKAGTIITVEDAMAESEIVAGNGVVQVIDRVMMPPKK